MNPMESLTEPTDLDEEYPPNGIYARNNNGDRLVIYLGIIDILQSYRFSKKTEHFLKRIYTGQGVSYEIYYFRSKFEGGVY